MKPIIFLPLIALVILMALSGCKECKYWIDKDSYNKAFNACIALTDTLTYGMIEECNKLAYRVSTRKKCND